MLSYFYYECFHLCHAMTSRYKISYLTNQSKMTKVSRGKKLLHLSKNPYQAKKQTQPRGLALLQKQSGSSSITYTGKSNGDEQFQTINIDIINTENKENGSSTNNIYLNFQELILGLEIINNSFIYYSNNYLLKVISNIKNNDVDMITKAISSHEAISIFLTLQTEYCYLYNNKVKDCNKYECDARTQNLFKDKNNLYYAMYMFDKKLAGHNLFKTLNKIPKFKIMQYRSRFDLVCDEIQRSFIAASKDFVDFVNDDLLKLNINANRENGYVELDIRKFKGDVVKFSSDALTKKDLRTIISNVWKISDDSSKYKEYLQEAKEIKVSSIANAEKTNQTDKPKPKSISTSLGSISPGSNYRLKQLCAVVSLQKETVMNDLNNLLQHEHVIINVNDSTESTIKNESKSAPSEKHLISSMVNDKVTIISILTILIEFVNIRDVFSCMKIHFCDIFSCMKTFTPFNLTQNEIAY